MDSIEELGAALYSRDESVRALALREISARRDVGALPYLHAALKDVAPSPFFCLLVGALGALGDGTSIEPLRMAYQKEIPEFARSAVLRALGQIKSSESEIFLRGVASQGSASLRLVALEGLAQLRVGDLAALLVEAFVELPSPEKIAALIGAQEGHDAVRALALRLFFCGELSEAQMRAAAGLFERSHEASAAPLLHAWSREHPTLRALCQRILRKLHAA